MFPKFENCLNKSPTFFTNPCRGLYLYCRNCKGPTIYAWNSPIVQNPGQGQTTPCNPEGRPGFGTCTWQTLGGAVVRLRSAPRRRSSLGADFNSMGRLGKKPEMNNCSSLGKTVKSGSHSYGIISNLTQTNALELKKNFGSIFFFTFIAETQSQPFDDVLKIFVFPTFT